MTTSQEHEAARASLERERARLTNDLGEIAELSKTTEQNFDDASEVLTEHDEDQILTAELSNFLNEVEAALARLDAGTFGVCESCGEPIEPARLEAMPTARVCMRCSNPE